MTTTTESSGSPPRPQGLRSGTSDLPAAARTLAGHLVELVAASPGGVARLKRGAGKRLGDADLRGETASEFYRLVARTRTLPRYAMEGAFLVSSLFPLTKRHSAKGGDLGATLRFCRTKTNGAGLDRRVQALLDSDEKQLPYRLRRAIQYAAGREPPAPVNWAQLLEDVVSWGRPGSRAWVRRRWAEAYFIGGARQESPVATGDTDDTNDTGEMEQE